MTSSSADAVLEPVADSETVWDYFVANDETVKRLVMGSIHRFANRIETRDQQLAADGFKQSCRDEELACQLEQLIIYLARCHAIVRNGAIRAKQLETP